MPPLTLLAVKRIEGNKHGCKIRQRRLAAWVASICVYILMLVLKFRIDRIIKKLEKLNPTVDWEE
jgi:hypothetical protein